MAAETPKATISDLQRQLVMAQVRILELEDIRDDARTRLADLETLLRDLQGKADRALGDFDHLQAAHGQLLSHRDHLQHLLHVANQALEESRGQAQRQAAELQAAGERETGLRATLARLEQELAALLDRTARLEERGRDLERQIQELTSLAGARLDRINQLDAELRAMKASRSWRWTKPLRAIERFLGRR